MSLIVFREDFLTAPEIVFHKEALNSQCSLDQEEKQFRTQFDMAFPFVLQKTPGLSYWLSFSPHIQHTIHSELYVFITGVNNRPEGKNGEKKPNGKNEQ